MSQSTAWRIIAVLTVIGAGASLGNERAQYFWDLSVYVASLDSVYPYRYDSPYPFLYPPLAANLFTLARSHLFELFSIAYIGAIAWFLKAFAALGVPGRFEWLAAITAMGGLGVVSLLSGNVGVLMNLGLLAVVIQAAQGGALARMIVPVAIGLGALVKPQFVLYLGLLPLFEKSRPAAIVKMIAVGVGVAGAHALSMLLRPEQWNEYVQAVIKRTVVERDFGWGPAALGAHFTGAPSAPYAAYVAGLLIASSLGYVTWRRSQRSGRQMPAVATVGLAFFVLTFANPRIPLYDLYAAAVALSICCSLAARPSPMSWVLGCVLAINLVPWTIANFARVPGAWPWWLSDLLIMHTLAIGSLLIALSCVGIRHSAELRPSRSAAPAATG